MKKLIALVLSLVLCVSMIPAAIATEGSVPATGVYFALENGLPAGDRIQGEENQDNVPIYEGLVYSPDEAFTFYYYDNDGTDAAALTLSDNGGNRDAKESGGFADVAITPLGTDGKLWQVSFTPTKFAEFNLDFMFNSGNNGHNVLFCFCPNTPDVPAPPTYATGFYLDTENNGPKGDAITGYRAEENSPWGYWDISYDSSEEKVLYYYDTEASDLSLRSTPDECSAVVDLVADHFWKITFRAPEAGYGNFTMDIGTGDGGFPVSFVDSFVPAYATGFYLDTENSGPKGDAITGSRPDANGPWGYWDVPYDSSERTVLYYYDGDASDVGILSKPDGFAVSVSAVDNHFWEITIYAPHDGYGPFALDIGAGNSNFPVYFTDNFSPSYEPGLYYRPIRGVEIDRPDVDKNAPYSFAPLVMSPYFERFDRAFYFYDGNEFTPVEVGFDSDLTVDPVGFDNRPGWYLFAAYDFCDGKIFYDDDSTQTTYYLDVSTRLPDLAFYADDTVSEENFRMYTIAEENTSSSYKFSKTLTLLPKDPDFSFGLGPGSNIDLEFTCFQRQYQSNGTEDDEIPYTDFDLTWEAGHNGAREYIEVTLYTNDSDILFHLDGYLPVPGDDPIWLYGSYVNILAPVEENGAAADTSLIFHANSQGNFAAAKFLPKHLFEELAALGRSVTIGHEQFPGNITLDKDVVDSIADESKPVSFCMTADAATAEEESLIEEALKTDETALDVLDLKLYFGSESKHELGGKATIQYNADLTKGTQVRVYYLNDAGELERMDAKYQNGNIIFTTSHFSKFLLVTAPAASSRPDPDPAPSRPSSSTSKPAKPADPPKPAAAKFADVAEGYWAKSAIDWAAEKGYVTGTSDTAFSPESNISRQQIWMMLSRVSGVNAKTMAAAKDWAMAAGITDGTNPGTSVTRQQLVTLLYRYAVLMGYDVSVGENTNILSYDDAFSVSEYAIPAFQWACGAGVINGTTESTLSPLGTATRAQFAVMLQRFCEKVVK